MLLASLVVIESLPILSKISGGTKDVTTAEAFAFAILLGLGTTPAVVALALAVLVSELLRRAGPEKLVFNVGQYSLLMAVAGGVYELLGATVPSAPRTSRPSPRPRSSSSSATSCWSGWSRPWPTGGTSSPT